MRLSFILLISIGIFLQISEAISFESLTIPKVSETASVSVNDDASSIFINPAGISTRRLFITRLTSAYLNTGEPIQFQIGIAMPFLGLGVLSSKIDTSRVNIYSANFALGFGTESQYSFGIGIASKWFTSDLSNVKGGYANDIGLIYRPYNFISIGAVAKNLGFEEWKIKPTYCVGAGFRPFGNRLTFMGDLFIQDRIYRHSKIDYLIGVEFEPVYGLIFRCSQDSKNNINAGISFNLPQWSFGYYSGFKKVNDNEQNIELTTHIAEIGFSVDRNRTTFSSEDKIVEIDIYGNLGEEGSTFNLFGPQITDVHSIIGNIRKSAMNPSIKGILLNIYPLRSGYIGEFGGLVQEIKDAIDKAKLQGKVVVAYLVDGGGSAEYYLATSADRIVIPQTASIVNLGSSIEIIRTKGLYEKLGIDWELQTSGEYKATFFPITDSISSEQKLEIDSLVLNVYEQLVNAIVKGRKLSADTVRAIADGRIITAQEALDIGLVDEIGSSDDAKVYTNILCGYKETNPDKIKVARIDNKRSRTYDWANPPLVAVIIISGDIVNGSSSQDILFGNKSFGAITASRLLEKVRKNDAIKSVVIRIDSPGGSATASDAIYNEIWKVKRAGKPVVVSIGDIATSGAYWIASCGDYIFAEPATITGSIGVASAKPVLKRLYDKLGITSEVYKQGRYSDMFSTSREFTNEEREMIQKSMDSIYQLFKKRVAEGRNLSAEDVDKIANGRIYTGQQALELGLIDELGGLSSAIAESARRGGIKNTFRVITYKTTYLK